MSRTTRRQVLLACASAALLLQPLAALAGGHPRHHPRAGGPHAHYQITLRTGEFEPDGDSDLWEENAVLYGLTAAGISDWTWGAEFGTEIGHHMEVLFGIDFYSGEDASYRFVDTDGVPVVLSSDLEIMPVTVSLKFAPFGRRGHGGSFRRLVPYLGGGAGIYFWDYEEVGDFIDPVTDVVTTGRAEADGAAFGTHVLLGLEVAVTPCWSLMIEGRRSFVDDDLGGLFEGFEEFDLSGDSLLVGASFRF
jgi:hypothetical protein